MAALVADGQRVTRESLLGGLHRESDHRPVRGEAAAAAVGIEPIFRIAEQLSPFRRPFLGPDTVGSLSPVNRTTMSRFGLKPAAFKSIIAWVMPTMPSFMSIVPRP